MTLTQMRELSRLLKWILDLSLISMSNNDLKLLVDQAIDQRLNELLKKSNETKLVNKNQDPVDKRLGELLHRLNSNDDRMLNGQKHFIDISHKQEERARESLEINWEKKNKAGYAITQRHSVTLWNFGVHQSQLKEAHLKALKDFADRESGDALLRDKSNSRTRFIIKGYASSTGEESSNEMLAKQRADQVKKWLLSYGYSQKSISINVGEILPMTNEGGDVGQQLAMDRKVTLGIIIQMEPESVVIHEPKPEEQVKKSEIKSPSMFAYFPSVEVPVSIEREGKGSRKWKLKVEGKLEFKSWKTFAGIKGFKFNVKENKWEPTNEIKVKSTKSLDEFVKDLEATLESKFDKKGTKNASVVFGFKDSGLQFGFGAERGFGWYITASYALKDPLAKFEDFEIWCQLKVELKVEPSLSLVKEALEKGGRIAVLAGEKMGEVMLAYPVIPTVVGSLSLTWIYCATAAMIHESVSRKAVEDSKVYALRNGFSVRITEEFCQNETDKHYHKLEENGYRGLEKSIIDKYLDGYRQADQYLDKLKAKQEEKYNTLKSKYATPKNFDELKNRIFHDLGGFNAPLNSLDPIDISTLW